MAARDPRRRWGRSTATEPSSTGMAASATSSSACSAPIPARRCSLGITRSRRWSRRRPEPPYRQVMEATLRRVAATEGSSFPRPGRRPRPDSLPSWPFSRRFPPALAGSAGAAGSSRSSRTPTGSSSTRRWPPSACRSARRRRLGDRSYKPAPGHWEAFFADVTGADATAPRPRRREPVPRRGAHRPDGPSPAFGSTGSARTRGPNGRSQLPDLATLPDELDRLVARGRAALTDSRLPGRSVDRHPRDEGEAPRSLDRRRNLRKDKHPDDGRRGRQQRDHQRVGRARKAAHGQLVGDVGMTEEHRPTPTPAVPPDRRGPREPATRRGHDHGGDEHRRPEPIDTAHAPVARAR